MTIYNIYDNRGIIGHANAPVTIENSNNSINDDNNIIGNGNKINSSVYSEKLSDQEVALLDIFKRLNVVKQAQLLAHAAELEKEGEGMFKYRRY